MIRGSPRNVADRNRRDGFGKAGVEPVGLRLGKAQRLVFRRVAGQGQPDDALDRIRRNNDRPGLLGSPQLQRIADPVELDGERLRTR